MSWVLDTHPDALGTCKSGSWGAIVGEELACERSGRNPKTTQPGVGHQRSGGGSVEVLRDPGDGTASEGVHFAGSRKDQSLKDPWAPGGGH